MASCEEKVEEYYKSLLDDLNIRHFGKTESINSSITKALEESDSKSGGSGNNYPDIQLLLQNKTRRDIPVMIEAKGAKNKLEKLTPNGDIELVSNSKNPHRAVQQYAVNGALHYGLDTLWSLAETVLLERENSLVRWLFCRIRLTSVTSNN